MTVTQVESRLTALEQEVARLRLQIAAAPARPSNPHGWVEQIAGTFAHDPLYEEAVRLGRKWRQKDPLKAETKRTSRHRKRNGQR